MNDSCVFLDTITAIIYKQNMIKITIDYTKHVMEELQLLFRPKFNTRFIGTVTKFLLRNGF